MLTKYHLKLENNDLFYNKLQTAMCLYTGLSSTAAAGKIKKWNWSTLT